MKRWRIVFASPDGDQVVTLLAASKAEAEQDALAAQVRREGRFPLTFDRIQQAHEKGELTADQFKAELERRKKDMGRYEAGNLVIKSVTEVK